MSLNRSNTRVVLNHSVTLVSGTTTTADTLEHKFVLEADTMLISLYVEDLPAGVLDVAVYTYGQNDTQKLLVAEFPSITGPTTQLLLKKAAVALTNMQLVVTHPTGCTFSVVGKGLSLGETSVDILSSTNLRATQETVGDVAQILIPASLEDRKGIILKNNSSNRVLYIGGALAETTLDNGWAISPGETLAVDLAAGQVLYAIASQNEIDVRILEAGA